MLEKNWAQIWNQREKFILKSLLIFLIKKLRKNCEIVLFTIVNFEESRRIFFAAQNWFPCFDKNSF